MYVYNTANRPGHGWPATTQVHVKLKASFEDNGVLEY